MCKVKIIILLLIIAISLNAEIEYLKINGRVPENYFSGNTSSQPLRSRDVIDNVPSYKWSYGCSPTAGAMLIAYYDHYLNGEGKGYVNLYPGNLPQDNSGYGTTTWPDYLNGGTISVNECPLSASHQGIGGQTGRGHVDDFWLGFGSTGEDPYITNNWNLHEFNCLADYCGTSQNGSGSEPYDGATVVAFFEEGIPYYGNGTQVEFCYGLQNYCESKGYVVDYAYNQYIYEEGLEDGFTLNELTNELDDGNPVVLHFLSSAGGYGHTMLAFGYDIDPGTDDCQIYVKTTWDFSYDSFYWGEPFVNNSISYDLIGVTVLHLEELGFSSPESDFIEVQAEDTDIQININTSGIESLDWTASITEGSDWLTFSSNNQGSGNGTIYISFSENTTTSDRYGNIIVSTNEAHPYLDDIEIAILQYQYGENAIYVSPNGSIQNAIDSVLPGEAKIIFVYPGIYAENLVIDNWLGSRQIKLSSIGDALDTILKMDDGCANSILRVIGCGTDLIRIEGFTFRGGTEGSEIGVISEEGVLGGGAISIQESYVNISNCVITDNEADGYGGAIFIRDSELNMNNVTIFDNQLSETARVDGGGIYIYGDSQVNMLNSIMYDNTPNDIASHNDAGQIVDIDYSMINIVDTGQTGLSLYQCIEGYPVICTYSDDDVNLVGCIMEGSPCIDAGRGNLYDEDCTTSDMGAIPTVVDVKVCEGDHWNWESFPRVGELQTDISDNISDILDADDLYPLYEYNPGIQINSQTQVGFTVFTGDVWDPERTIYSAVGYKVNRDDDENFYVPLEGYRLCNNYQFNLTANEDKWLGYWIPETRNIVDAFNDLWSHVKTIYAEDWCYKRPINGLSTPSSVTTGKNLEYGKMYIVTTDISTTYTWDPPGGGGPGQNSERETPKYFYFADQPDYLAVDVLDIPQGIEEIGVFQGTTCIGASVVESESEQILAYVDPELRDEYELSFQLISEDRSRIVIDNCWVYDENNGEFDKDQIKIDSDGYILLSFKVDYPDGNCPIPGCYLYQNYPNPFNPETNIRFYLSSETSGAELTIYNIRGQEVKNYDLVSYKGGREHEVTWNGINNAGTKVSSGIYFCRLSSDQGSVSNKMVLIK